MALLMKGEYFPIFHWLPVSVSAAWVKTPLRGSSASAGPGEHKGELWCAIIAWPPNLSAVCPWRLTWVSHCCWYRAGWWMKGEAVLTTSLEIFTGCGCAFSLRMCDKHNCLLHISLLLCSFRWRWASEPCPSAPWCPCPAVPIGSTSRDSTALASSTACKVRGWDWMGSWHRSDNSTVEAFQQLSIPWIVHAQLKPVATAV